MKREKVFIIGAGASKEFELPTGVELVTQIEQLCNFQISHIGNITSGDNLLRRCFKRMESSNGDNLGSAHLVQVAERIRQNMGLAPSIDNFLGSHVDKEGWVEVGKLVIARAILKAERASKLWFEDNNIYNKPDFASLKENWLTELFKTLGAGRGVDDFSAALRSCKFITFNYDRVIEHFFHQAIKSYFDLDAEATDEICRENLKIVHVYGSLGEISCQNPRGFGNVDDVTYLLSSSKAIKVFTEGFLRDDDLKRARGWIQDANALIISGFGYLPLNLRVLAPTEGAYSLHVRFMSAKGVSPHNLEIAESIMKREWYGGKDYLLNFHDLPAHEIIRQNSFYLSEYDL